MKIDIVLIFIFLLVFLLAGCNEISNDEDIETENNTGGNSDGNNILSGPTIQELVDREKQYNYSYSVQSISCRDGTNCNSPTNSTMKIGNSFGYTLGISHKEDYNSYYLTDYNDMVIRQWAPGRLVYGSEVECHGSSIAGTIKKTLIDMNTTIVGREKMNIDGNWVDCTHVIYYTYQTYSPDEINMIYEQWIWDDYGVKVKTHIYRPPDDPHLTDFDVTSTHYNFVFNELTILDFAYPDPCNIID